MFGSYWVGLAWVFFFFFFHLSIPPSVLSSPLGTPVGLAYLSFISFPFPCFLMAICRVCQLFFFPSWDTCRVRRLFSKDTCTVSSPSCAEIATCLACLCPRSAHLEQSLKPPYTFVMLGRREAPEGTSPEKACGFDCDEGLEGRLLLLSFLFLFLSPISEVFSTDVRTTCSIGSSTKLSISSGDGHQASVPLSKIYASRAGPRATPTPS